MSGLAVETAIISALLVVVTVAVLVRRFNLPYTIALVVMGLVLGTVPSFPTFELTPEVILLVFLPPLLFEASFNLEFASLTRNLTAILLLAVPGVVLGAFIIAELLHLTMGRSFESMLVFGALIAATDPISVLAIFSKLGAPQRLATIVEGESLFNDGVAIVLFGVVLTGATGGSTNIFDGVVEFVKVSIGGGLVGLFVALLAAALLHRIDDHLIEITITTVVAFGAYLVSEQLHVSGVIAVVVAGLVIGRSRDAVMSPTTRVMLSSFWEYVGFLGNSMIFLLMGMRIAAPELLGKLPAVALVMLAVLLSRSVIVALVNLVLRPFRQHMPWKWLPVVAWGGLRGAVALALALSLPADLPGRDWIQLMAFGVVLISILVQGLTMQPLLNWLGLGQPEQVELERHQARLYALRRALHLLQHEQRDGNLLPGVVSSVRDDYEAAVRKEEENLKASEIQPGFMRDQQVRQTRRRALLAQRSAILDLGRQGQLSSETLRELVQDIDAELARFEEQTDVSEEEVRREVNEASRDYDDDVDNDPRANETAARTDRT